MVGSRGGRTSEPKVSALFLYPIKGAKGFQPNSWALDRFGLRFDRRWMLVDAAGQSVSQRSHPRIALVETVLDGESVRLTAPGMKSEAFDFSLAAADGELVDVRLENEALRLSSVGGDANVWFSRYLDADMRVVAMPDNCDRWVDGDAEKRIPVSLSNAVPIHLVSESSLDDLNARLDVPVRMNRFRPNLVVSGTAPHEDDRWRRIQIGDVILRIVRACDHRCGVPNIDQETGARGVEPLRTLARYRRSAQGIYFGQNAVIERSGTLRQDEPIVVLESG